MKDHELSQQEIEVLKEMYEKELKSLVEKIETIKKMLKKLGVESDIPTFDVSDEIYAKPLKPGEPVKRRKRGFFGFEQEEESKKTRDRWAYLKEHAQDDPSIKEFIAIMEDDSIPVIDFTSENQKENKTKAKEKEKKEEVTEIIPENYRRSKNILWSDYILDILKITGYPLTVEELKDKAINDLILDEDEKENAYSAIHSALFRLKNNQKLIYNFALKGSRVSYYGLADWFTKEGKLLKKYSRF